MGQHKYNKTAIAAKNREIKPIEKGLTKGELKRILSREVKKKLNDTVGICNFTNPYMY